MYLLPAGRQINLPPPETGDSINAIEQKFFNTHRTADASEKAIVEYMKRQNDKLHFVAQTVKQIGYPRWDKAIAVSKTDASVNGRGQTGDSANIYYVPFVRDSENYVNASLVIKTNPADTSFSYLCDWQYSQRNYGSPSVDSTAEHLSLFFMIMDKNVFGHNRFILTDTALFASHPRQNDSTLRRVEIHETSNTGGRNNTLTTSICFELIVCGSPNNSACKGPNGCDYLNCGATPAVCYLTTVCIDFDEPPPSGGGGGGSGGTGGGSGGGGGGGGTGGGSGGGSGGSGGGSGGGGGGGTPPECGEPLQPLAGRINVMDPCGPGWVPDYGDGNTVSSEPDPCAKVAPLKTDTLFKNNINVLKTKLSGDREYAYLHKPDGSWPTSLIPGIPNECEVKVSLYTGMTNLRNYTHIHNNSCELPIFGTEDLKTIGEFLNVHKYLSPQHNLMDSLMSFGLLTDSAYYVLVIDNPNSLENFYFEYFSEDGSKDIKELSDNYNSYNIKRTNSSATNEQQFLQFLKREGIGMKLLKANSNLSAFSILSLNRNNNLVTTPCPQ